MSSTILVVEDEPAIQELIAVNLSFAGHKVLRAFDADQARAILTAGAAAVLKGRLHANQLTYGPGVQLACELGLVAVDHCTYLTDADVDALAQSGTIATILPGVVIGEKAMIGAGAVVIRDLPDFAKLAGNPAKVIF